MDQWQVKKTMGLTSILLVMFTLLLLGKGYSTEVQTYNAVSYTHLTLPTKA